MSEPLGLHHVTFIPLPAVDLPFLRILYGVSVADFNIFRNFLKSSLSIMHPPPPPPPPKSYVSFFFCISSDLQSWFKSKHNETLGIDM